MWLLLLFILFFRIFVPILYIEILKKKDNLKRQKFFKPLFVLLMVISMVNFSFQDWKGGSKLPKLLGT